MQLTTRVDIKTRFIKSCKPAKDGLVVAAFGLLRYEEKITQSDKVFVFDIKCFIPH